MKSINLIYSGGFTYPKGYAGTKLVQASISCAATQGYKPRVLSLWGWSKTEKWLREGRHNGVPYISINIPSVGNKIYCLLCYWWSVIQKMKFYRMKKYHNIVIFYGQPNLKTLPVLIFVKGLGYHIIFWIVEDYSVYDVTACEKGVRSGNIRMMRLLEPFLRVLGSGIIVISSSLERKFKPIGLPVKLIPVMTSFADTQNPALTPLRCIVYAGTYGMKDDVKCLIQAFLQVYEQRPDTILKMVGIGPERDHYMEMTAETKSVKWLGHLEDEDLQRVLNEPGIMCMTRTNSRYANAGFPYKLVEYLKTGNPVIATRVSDVDKYLDNGRDAILVNPEDSIGLAEAILFLLNNPLEAHQIGLRGQYRGRECFSSEVNGKQMLNFINKLAVEL